jgi:hypothetical protein
MNIVLARSGGLDTPAIVKGRREADDAENRLHVPKALMSVPAAGGGR